MIEKILAKVDYQSK